MRDPGNEVVLGGKGRTQELHDTVDAGDSRWLFIRLLKFRGGLPYKKDGGGLVVPFRG